MPSPLDRETIDLPCPECGHKNRKTVDWLRSHKEFTCGGCRKVKIETSSFAKGMREVDAELAKLTKSLNKTFRIKL